MCESSGKCGNSLCYVRRSGFIKAVLQGEAIAGLDPNHAWRQAKHPEGLALIPTAIYSADTARTLKRGHRSSPRERLREVQQKFPDRLVIATDCLVTKVILEDDANGGKKATGVEYLYGPKIYRAVPNFSQTAGRPGRIHARKEIILAGGAFNTPQLLMLSGIGPKEELEREGINIDCVIDSPGVGRNLQDRYEVTVVSRMGSDFSLLQGATLQLPTSPNPPDEHLAQWRQDGSGLYATNGAVLGILKRSRPDLAQPDLFIFGLPLKFLGYAVGL